MRRRMDVHRPRDLEAAPSEGPALPCPTDRCGETGSVLLEPRYRLGAVHPALEGRPRPHRQVIGCGSCGSASVLNDHAGAVTLAHASRAFGAQDPQSRSRDEMGLNVECVVDRSVDREETRG
jgi:hypothetical protein